MGDPSSKNEHIDDVEKTEENISLTSDKPINYTLNVNFPENDTSPIIKPAISSLDNSIATEDTVTFSRLILTPPSFLPIEELFANESFPPDDENFSEINETEASQIVLAQFNLPQQPPVLDFENISCSHRVLIAFHCDMWHVA